MMRRLLSGLAAVLLLTILVLPAAAQDAGAGELAGRVVHGVDAAGVPDLEVRLVTVSEGDQTELDRTTTDDEGRFSFPDVPHGPEVEVVTRFDEATYRSGPVRSIPGEVAPVDLTVFDTTEDPSAVRIASWVVWLDRDVGVSIQQDLQVVNDADLTWLGADPDPDGTRAVLSVPLHPQATGFGFLGRFAECCAVMRGIEYVHTSALPPGQTTATLRYFVEELEELTLPIRLPVDTFTLMLPDGVSIGGTPLEQAGQMDSRGQTYTMFGTARLEPGDVISLELRGLGPEQTSWWQYAAAAALALAVVAAGIVVLRGRRPGSDPQADEPEQTSPPVASATTSRPIALEHSDTEEVSDPVPALDTDLLLEELALLDEALERGLLTREVYEPLRAARMDEIRRTRASAGR